MPLAQRQAQAAMAITRRWIYRQAKPRLEKLFSLPTAEEAVVQGQQATTAQAEAAEAQAVLVLMAAPPMPLRRAGIQPSKARLLETGLVAEGPLVEQPMPPTTLDFRQNTVAEAEAEATTLMAKKLAAPVSMEVEEEAEA